jgi:hypothetical protein
LERSKESELLVRELLRVNRMYTNGGRYFTTFLGGVSTNQRGSARKRIELFNN